MDDWKKGSYYIPDLSAEEEIEILRRVSLSAADFERAIWRGLQLRENSRVMDLGCGPGFISNQLAEFFAAGQVLGVDVSHELIDYAEKQRQLRGPGNLRFKQSDIYQLDVEQNSFDMIYFRFVLQHLKCPQEAIRNSLPPLKGKGMICIVDIDDTNTRLLPSNRTFDSFNKRSAKGQAAHGGDRMIGHKLVDFCQKAGLQNIKEKIFKLSADEIGIDTFLDISVKFKLPTILQDERDDAIKEAEEIFSSVDRSKTGGSMDIYVVTGEKPKNQLGE